MQDARYIHTYAVYSCVWRLWVVFLEHGGGALGIFKSPVCTKSYNEAWTFSLSASHYFSFLSKRSGRRMPPAERSALYIIHTYQVYINIYIYIRTWEERKNERQRTERREKKKQGKRNKILETSTPKNSTTSKGRPKRGRKKKNASSLRKDRGARSCSPGDARYIGTQAAPSRGPLPTETVLLILLQIA